MWPPSISNTLELEWLMVHTYLIHIPFATFFLVPLVLFGSFWLRGRQQHLEQCRWIFGE